MSKSNHASRSKMTNRAAPSLPEKQYFLCCNRSNRSRLVVAGQILCFLLTSVMVGTSIAATMCNVYAIPQSQAQSFKDIQAQYANATSTHTLTSSLASQYFELVVEPLNQSTMTIWKIYQRYFDGTRGFGLTYTQDLRSEYTLCFKAHLFGQIIEGCALAMCTLAIASILFAFFGVFILHFTRYPLVISLFGTFANAVVVSVLEMCYVNTSFCGRTSLSALGWVYSEGFIAAIATAVLSMVVLGLACTIDVRYAKAS